MVAQHRRGYQYVHFVNPIALASIPAVRALSAQAGSVCDVQLSQGTCRSGMCISSRGQSLAAGDGRAGRE